MKTKHWIILQDNKLSYHCQFFIAKMLQIFEFNLQMISTYLFFRKTIKLKKYFILFIKLIILVHLLYNTIIINTYKI